jgi:hypothetical protein
MTQALEGEVIDQEGERELMLSGSEALTAYTSAEIDTQIATAKRYPRSIKAFKRQCEELACLDEETAATMFYSLPRGGKAIQGPSVRFAEVVGYAWGNLRYGARVIAVDDKFITAQGQCSDLEKNIACQVEVKRRITDKGGRRYNDDMIGVTGNAACSIALRNAIFKVVPFGLAKGIYERAQELVKGEAKSLVQRRGSAIEWFVKAGATEAQVLQALGRTGVDDVTLDDLVTLTGMRTAIKDGEHTIEEVLGPVPDASKKVKRSDLNDKLKPTGNITESIRSRLAECDTRPLIAQVEKDYMTAAKDDNERNIIAGECGQARDRLK